MRYVIAVIVLLFPVIQASDYCLLKSSFQINSRITTECKVPANATSAEDIEAMSTLCTDEEVAQLQILRARQTDFSSRGICHESSLKTPGMYTWITWKDFQNILRPLVSHLSEESAFVGRDVAGSICRVNLTTAACLGNDESDSPDVADVLLERLPVAYELTNIIYDRWRNVTFLDQIVLTSVNLTNHHLNTDFVESLVRYDFEKKVNVTLFSNLAPGVPIILHEETGTIKYTVGELTKKVQAGIVSVVKRLPAKTSAIVRVIGTETLSVINMSAKLTTIYARDDYGVDKIEEGDIHTMVSFLFVFFFDEFCVEQKITLLQCIETGVMDVRPEETISIHIDPPGVGDHPQMQQEPSTAPVAKPTQPTSTPAPAISLFQPSGPVYPGFKTYSTIAAVIFLSVFIIAMTDVARKIIQDQRRKDQKIRKY
uniref:Putative enolase binding protein n=1 Tax=Lutzomyia longipalpis TaxID=7200 RepID=A0A7G3AGY7_LUTLO